MQTGQGILFLSRVLGWGKDCSDAAGGGTGLGLGGGGGKGGGVAVLV